MPVQSTASPQSRMDSLWLTVITLLAAGLRFSGGLSRSFWIDEIATLAYLSGSFDHLVASLLEAATNPPLYFFSLFCIIPWGQSEFWLRLPSVLWGLLAVPLIYQLGRTSFDRRTGLLAALLLAISPYHIWYSQELRNYAMLTGLAVAVGYFFLKTLDSDGLKWWVGFIVTSSLAYATHYYAFLLPVSQLVFFILCLRQYRLHFRKWAVAQFVAFLPLIPWLYLLSRQETVAFGVGWMPAPTLLSPFLTLQGFSTGLSDRFTILTVFSLGITLLAVGLGMFVPQPHTKSSRLFLVLWLVVPFVLVLVISLRRVFYYHRYFVIVLPAYLTLMCAGATRLRPKIPRVALTLALIVIPLLSLWGYPNLSAFPQQDWRAVAQYIRENAESSDIIVVVGVLDVLVWRYYYDGENEVVMRHLDPITEAKRDLDTIHRPDTRLWIIHGGELDRDSRKWLEGHSSYVVEKRNFVGLVTVLVDAENP